jgi:hypothetical protein
MMRHAVAAAGLVVVALLAGHSSPVRAQPVASISLPAPRASVDLYPGCNNITLTFADGTASETVVDAVTPVGMVESMWRHNAATGRFEGFNPDFPEVSDLRVVDLWDAVWLCLGGASGLPSAAAPPPPSASGGLIQPSDLVYLGAFRLPDGPEEYGWAYSGAAMAYYPDGDSGGPNDGYPGSIFGTGHNWNQWVSEVSIPVPVVSPSKNVEDLNTATTLQDFHDIRGGLFPEFEMPRAGLEYLPAQDGQTTGKLYFCWTQHLAEGDTGPSHGWSELDLSNPQTAGAWRIGDYWTYVTTDYIFAIPQAWADANTPGMYLATGRFRDGGQGSQGPTIFAYGPWNEGNPPAPGSTLSAIPLLLYSDVTAEEQHTMNNYQHSDEWSGGAWLTASGKSAVVFVGTKGQGDCWYGNPAGPCLECENRGWWSTSFEGQIIFYDPADLAAVARGEMAPYEPQPYATLAIDQYLYHIESSQQWYHVGAASFDRQRGLLYVFEPTADDDKSLVHVWRVEG